MPCKPRPIPFLLVIASALCAIAVDAQQTPVPPLAPYPLPAKAAAPVIALAARSDVLVLGELHGTREVPELTASLLPELDRMGYRALALEVPAGQRLSIATWAVGGSSRVPTFYDGVHPDGRGNTQMLALIRTALSAPYHWKVICFDTDSLQAGATWQARDMGMARNFAAQWRNITPGAKVLAICGNLHARTADHASPGGQMVKLWPSSAADLKRAFPGKRVCSIDVAPQQGGYFNGGKVNSLHGRALSKAETRRVDDWDLELSLPSATPATFLMASKWKDALTSPLDGLPIQAFRITGNHRVPNADILRVIRSKPGRKFSAETLKADLSAVFGLSEFRTVGPFDVRKTPQGSVIITLPLQENPPPPTPDLGEPFHIP